MFAEKRLMLAQRTAASSAPLAGEKRGFDEKATYPNRLGRFRTA